MQIKEAAALCGLTEKAIRLYEEKGLITPTYTEKNGREFLMVPHSVQSSPCFWYWVTA